MFEVSACGSVTSHDVTICRMTSQELAQTELRFSEDGGMRVAPPTSKEDHTQFGLLPEPVVVFHALDSSAE